MNMPVTEVPDAAVVGPSECARRIAMLCSVLPFGSRLTLVSQLDHDCPSEVDVVLLGDPTWMEAAPRRVDMVRGRGPWREFSQRMLDAHWLDALVIVSAVVVGVPVGQVVDER